MREFTFRRCSFPANLLCLYHIAIEKEGMDMAKLTMDKLVALCKNRGYIFAGSEIYGGLSNTWDRNAPTTPGWTAPF